MNLTCIVVATDLSESSLPALETALNLTLETTATLHLVHVIEVPAVAPAIAPAVAPVEPPIENLRQQALRRLKDLIPENWEQDIRIETVVLVGAASREIASFAFEKDADMIIVGTHGRKGISRILMGSTAESLLRAASCQVLVVKPKHTHHETIQ
jgi:nucleotide-binding universal stress UspA family protein